MKLNKLVILDWGTMSYHPGELDLKDFYALANEVEFFPATAPEEAAARIGKADGVICNKVPITREVIEACRELRYIGVLATGYNNIDLEAAAERRIPVCNAGSYSTDAVTQLVFSYLLDRCEKMNLYATGVRLGEWQKAPAFSYFPYPTAELRGRTLGIVGYGNIGRSVARIAEAFGMAVLVHTRTPRGDYPNMPLEQLLRKSDFVTLHCPLTPQTKGLINKKTLALMKETAVLINTARGGLIVEEDLADALAHDMIAAAYVDVLEKEPMTADTPLKSAKNCIITPHIGWTPVETRQRLIAVTVENLRGWLSGCPQNIVNGVTAQISEYRAVETGPEILPKGHVPGPEDRVIRPIQETESGSPDMLL